MTAVSSTGYGTPVTARPMPAMTDCTSAVTTMPSATARMAWADSTATRSPASPASRRAKASTPAAATSPREYRIAEIATASRS